MRGEHLHVVVWLAANAAKLAPLANRGCCTQRNMLTTVWRRLEAATTVAGELQESSGRFSGSWVGPLQLGRKCDFATIACEALSAETACAMFGGSQDPQIYAQVMLVLTLA